MNFGQPGFLFTLLLLPLAALLLLRAHRLRGAALERLGDRVLVRRLTGSINTGGRRWRAGTQLFALAMILISLARPQWGQEVREIEQEGLQVIVALDVSQSMLAEDIKPNRLERAKLEIADLMDRLDGDEIGIVPFSGASFLMVPLTSDYQTARSYLGSADPGIISRPGTVMGEAIRTALLGFDPDAESQKVLVIMTDGEDRETDPLAAAQVAAEAGVQIYTIGFGTPDGEPVPETNEFGEVIGYKTDSNGDVVISQLAESSLQAVAAAGNGKYFRASSSGAELDALLTEIDSLQREQLGSRAEIRPIERYQLFLGLGLAALILGELIPDRVIERRRIWRRNRGGASSSSSTGDAAV